MNEKNLTRNTLPDNAVTELQAEVARLQAVHKAMIQLNQEASFDELIKRLTNLISEMVTCDHVVVFVINPEDGSLHYRAISKHLSNAENQRTLRDSIIGVRNVKDDAVLGPLLAGKTVEATADLLKESKVSTLGTLLNPSGLLLVPVCFNDALLALLAIDAKKGKTISTDDRAKLEHLAESVAVTLRNARMQDETVAKLKASMREMNILQQIDEELNANIELNHVFNMTLDWALRFTNAHAASLALYNEPEDALRTITDYGYNAGSKQLTQIREESQSGISYRVARSGMSEVIPDISFEKDYVPVMPGVRAQMAVPVTREDKVVAVVTLESKKLDGFNDEHLEFVKKLSTRAATAIDNARLFTETEHERGKLTQILRNIADIVMVIGTDNRFVLVNQSAIAAFRLYADQSYVGRNFFEVIDHNQLRETYRRAAGLQESVIEELELTNSRIYHTHISRHDDIGWIIVMQDITPFKEMDRLKSELIATVSHDLKQPLSVMRGYLDLLQMSNNFDERSITFVDMIDKSIRNMRNLIDDLLDLARIESGLELAFESIRLKDVLKECIEENLPRALNKNMTLVDEIPDNLPTIRGEAARLRQIFTNLISNAVKYTPPDGEIRINAEKRSATVRVQIKDNGLGISPEDQARIFDRFYRVRRPETDSIDGTGLGLAIVKKLVEAHQGKIGLESELGEGSVFFVTLPTESAES